MPDFTAVCQAARQAYQDATNAYNTARDTHLATKGVLTRATDALTAAQAELADATDAMNAAIAAWDAHINGIKADPSLGVPNVEAGVLPPDAAPAGASVAGLIQSRLPPNFSIWAKGTPEDQAAWLQLANPELQGSVVLERAHDAAQSELNAKTAAHTAAEAAKDAARQAEEAAQARRTAASEAASAALAQVGVACEGQRETHPLPGGGTIEIDPGTLPDEEDEVRDLLDSLPDKEKEDLDTITLDEDFEVKPDGGWVNGHYVVADESITLFVTGHSAKVLKHELGHHVFHSRLSDAARARWNQFYAEGTNGQQVPAGKMPTGYGTTDAGEGFAEVYEFLRDNKQLDPEVKRLMEDLLGGIS